MDCWRFFKIKANRFPVSSLELIAQTPNGHAGVTAGKILCLAFGALALQAALQAKLPYKPSNEQLHQLLPDQWLIANPDKRWEIAEIRKNERNKT